MVKVKKNLSNKASAAAPKPVDAPAEVVANNAVEKIGKNKKKALKRAADKSAAQKQPVAKVAKPYVDSSSDDDEEENIDEPLIGSDDEEVEIDEPEQSASEDEEQTDEGDASVPVADDDDDTNTAVDSNTKSKQDRSGISVFVGNLPSNIKRDRVIKLFRPYANVTQVRFRRNDGGQLFNVKTAELDSIIAFVDVPNEEVGLAASAGLNGTLVGTHILRVNLQRNARTAEQMDEKRTICVGNLAYKVTDELLRETFECCGEIEYVRTLQSAQGCKGVGFVCFAEAASVPMAFELNGGLLLERPIRVDRYKASRKPSAETQKKRHASFGAQRRLAAKIAKGGSSATTGAANGKARFQRQMGKVVKSNGSAATGKQEKGGKKKRSEFAGAKTSDKKSGDKRKKGGLKGDKLLAKKIAPRA